MSTNDTAFPCEIQVMKSPEGSPGRLVFPVDRVGITAVLSEAVPDTEVSAFLNGVKSAEKAEGWPQLAIRVVIAGKRQLTEKPKSADYYWLAPGEESRFDFTAGPAILYILKGRETVVRMFGFPKDAKAAIPRLSLSQLPSKLSSGDTADIIAVYREVKATYGEVATDGIRALLTALSSLWGVDITAAAQCFESHRFPTDPEDIIDPRDLSLKQFCRRLRNYALSKSHSPSASTRSVANPALQSRIAELEAEVAALKATIKDRDRQVLKLKVDLQAADSRIEDLSKYKHRAVVSSDMDEVLLDDSPTFSHSPVKGSPMSAGLKPNSLVESLRPVPTLNAPVFKGLTLSPTISPAQSAVIAPMLNLRPPQQKDRRKSPRISRGPTMKAALRVNANLKKIDTSDRGLFQQAGRLTISRHAA